ncbi:KH domain-containing protein [Desulfogranum mediterraneum]|uniref:KH domain-containing protein n=1 Tax=Desulfogranum mediterraneum TaxID=160661 RepID=UPI000410D905|nr:KH domain-containing protein [Desulfogranum mediterraneum]
MKALIEFIAQRLVDKPEEVNVTLQEEDDSVTVELRVAQEDLGKVIGKQGRTVRAMRTVLSAALAGENKRSRLEIIE